MAAVFGGMGGSGQNVGSKGGMATGMMGGFDPKTPQLHHKPTAAEDRQAQAAGKEAAAGMRKMLADKTSPFYNADLEKVDPKTGKSKADEFADSAYKAGYQGSTLNHVTKAEFADWAGKMREFGKTHPNVHAEDFIKFEQEFTHPK